MAWDLTDATYSTKSFSVGSQDSAPRGVAIENDGAKMYIAGSTNARIYQYTLTTPGDISTAGYDSVSFNIFSQASSPFDVCFKADGTKMYVLAGGTDVVHQYSLSTAWDLTTAAYDSVSFSLATQDATPFGIFFKTDGTKMYMVGDQNNGVFQYSLSTAWDLTTISYDSVSFSVASQAGTPIGLALGDEGEKLYVLGLTDDTVYQYDLSTPWVVSSGAYNSVSFSVGGQEGTPVDVEFSDDGTSMYIIGLGNDTVYQYSMPAEVGVANNAVFFAANF